MSTSGWSGSTSPSDGTSGTSTDPYATPSPDGQASYGSSSSGSQPYGHTPPASTPYGQAPFGEQPYGQAPYGQAPYGQQPYGYPYGQSYVYPYAGGRQQEKNSLGILALVCGIAAWMGFGPVTGVPAIILGVMSRRAADQGLADNRGLGTAGFWLGIISTVLVVVIVVIWLLVFAAVVTSAPDGSYVLGAAAPLGAPLA